MDERVRRSRALQRRPICMERQAIFERQSKRASWHSFHTIHLLGIENAFQRQVPVLREESQ